MSRAGVLPSARRKAFSHSYWRRRRWRRRHDKEIYHFQGRQRRHRVDICQWTGLHLAAEWDGASNTIESAEIAVKGSRDAPRDWPLTSWNLILLYCLVWYKDSAFKRMQASAHTVRRWTHREIDHSIVHGLKEGVSTGVQFHLAGFGIQG